MIRLLKSLITSITRAIVRDHEVKSWGARHPRLFTFLKKRLTPDSVFGLHLTIGSMMTLLFVFLFFGVVQDLIGQDPLIQSDLRVINLLQIFRTPLFNKVMLFATYLGTWQIVTTGLIAAGCVLALYKQRHYVIALATSVVGGELFVWLMKHAVARPRPSLVNALAPEKSFSFPSGHSFIAISFYGLLCYFIFRSAKNKALKLCAILAGAIIILAIGFSRIYLGVHWPSDVLAGYASAAAWLTILITALEIRRGLNNHVAHKSARSPGLRVTAGILLAAAWIFYTGYFFTTHPLHAPKTRAEQTIIVSKKDIPQNFFPTVPKTSEDITGKAMEPVNIIVVGSQKQLTEALQKEGWFLTDTLTARSLWRLMRTSVLDQPYPQAPGTPSFWNTQPNEIAYEHPTEANTVRERHHVHLWSTPFVTSDGQAVWFGTAHFDKAIAFSKTMFFPLHRIDPAVDKEREKIKNDLLSTGLVEEWSEFHITEPTLGSNQAGDYFFTDGKSYIFFLMK